MHFSVFGQGLKLRPMFSRDLPVSGSPGTYVCVPGGVLVKMEITGCT